AERMFFVTLLLNEVIAWMRTQPGTGSLRAIVYMDEIMGYFPPSRNPPSKAPMMTLLKQARAFGVGVVLATQNPVDLDYKGLSNTGTWLIGRLQTERDKMRLLDGLQSAGGGGMDPVTLDRRLSSLGKRVFLMHNVHEDQPILFHTRWAMSYLRGPMTRPQIERLTSEQANAAPARPGPPSPVVGAVVPATPGTQNVVSEPPVLPDGVSQAFLAMTEPVSRNDRVTYVPMLFGAVRLRHALSKAGVDEWSEAAFIAPLESEDPTDPWADAQRLTSTHPDSEPAPETPGAYAELPASARREATFKRWGNQLESYTYRSADGVVLYHAATKSYSALNADEASFAQQVRHLLREQRDRDIEKLRSKFAPKLASMEARLRKAEERVDREKSQARQQGFQTAISVGSTILGALFGRKKSSVGRATTALRGAGRIASERDDVGRAEESLESLRDQMRDMEADFEAQVSEMQSTEFDPTFESITVRPRKSDISIRRFAVMWVPMKETGVGREPLARMETM
ncbi:MAG: ATP-binding protein, partial [Phycisphaerales bacterium]|nr:ATP-binding protein [Phycisphaerales bacterium]